MTTDPLAKHYETLSGAERFGLLIDAMSRNDKVEEGRVNDSCPMTAFKIEDPSYRGRVRQSTCWPCTCRSKSQRGWPGSARSTSY